MLKKAVQEWMQDSGAHSVEVRIGSLTSLLAGLLLKNRIAASAFLIAVPIGTIVLSTWSEYVVRRWSQPFRPGARGGLAAGSTIVPLVFVASGVCLEVNQVKNLDALYYYIVLLSGFSMATMVCTVCLMAPPPNNYGLVFVMSMILCAVANLYLPETITMGFLWLVIPLWLYLAAGARLVTMLPASFSAGEAVIITQTAFLLVFDVTMQTIRSFGLLEVPRMFVRDRSKVLLAVEVMLLFALVVVPVIITTLQSLSLAPSYRSISEPARHRRLSIVVWACLLGSTFSLLLPWMHLVMNTNVYMWLFSQLLSSTRLVLIGYWTVCLSIAALIVQRGFLQRKLISTNRFKLMVARKKFHFLAVAIYLPGLLWDQELMKLASGVALAAFIVAEHIRALKLWPIGAALHQYLSVFVDSRDHGHAILTHVYLLLGFAMPIFAYPLSSFGSAPKLATYAGLLSLGLGDSAASLVGMKWGRRKWPRMNKTIEGTLAAIVVQLLGCAALFMLDSDVAAHITRSWMFITTAIVTASVLEAFTSHIDNLILPPYLFALLMLT